MHAPFFQIDAFTEQAFGGNPAAVLLLNDWLADDVLQAIASENNLSETSFILPKDERGHVPLRWFTPGNEVDLCGHATLAAAHCLFAEQGWAEPTIQFETRSGVLTVKQVAQGRYQMDFPALPPSEEFAKLADFAAMMGMAPVQAYSVPRVHGADYLLLRYASQADIAALDPDFRALAAIGNVIATAPADSPDYDFVSRFFAPAVGVDEDPVTGSAHATLAPYWAEMLGKSELVGRQISVRGGTVQCQMDGARVLLAGHAVTMVTGQFLLG